MVGVPKSTGCKICRRRKIKCDETWPNCLNCQKNRQDCPGPPPKYSIFEPPKKGSRTTRPTGKPTAIDKPTRKTGTDRLTQIEENVSETGSARHTFEFTYTTGQQEKRTSLCATPSTSSESQSLSPHPPFTRHPTPSRLQNLSLSMTQAIDTGGIGHRMSALGTFIREIPSRVGHNEALDAAVDCLVDAHSSLLHKKRTTEIANPRLYLRAIQTLQKCLEHPKRGMSPNTLCAAVLLGLVEAFSGPRAGNRYLAHVGGAGRLMELQGPGRCQDPFVKEMLRFNRGGIIMTSIFARKPCFLTSETWRDIAFDKTGLSQIDCLYADVLHRMAEFPGLLQQLRALDTLATSAIDPVLLSGPLYLPLQTADDYSADMNHFQDFSTQNYQTAMDSLTSPLSSNTSRLLPDGRSALLDNLYKSREKLSKTGAHLNSKITDGTAATEHASAYPDSPFPTAYRFRSWRDAVAFNCYWSLVILTNKLIAKLLPAFDLARFALESECRTLAVHICKSWEDAWESKPIGAFHTGLSFVVAYEYCTPDVQGWILGGLNALLQHQHVESFRWTEEIIKSMSGTWAGEGPDPVVNA